MKKLSAWIAFAALLLAGTAAAADKYADTVTLFQKAGQSAAFFHDCYGYAVFPTIDKGALLIGGARGTGRVYEQGKYVGDTTLTQLSIGLQAGGEAYSQIVFLRDKRAFDEFTRGNFEFDANASAVAITASAATSAGTTGASTELNSGKGNPTTAGQYYNGMAVFTSVKGGALFAAAVAGQKFSYKPLPAQAASPAQPTPAQPTPGDQQTPAGNPPPPPGYPQSAPAPQPPPSYQQPPAPQQPPPAYPQAPRPQPASPGYPQAPPPQEPPPGYQQAPPPQQPPPGYQQAPPNYPQPPPNYQQAPPNYPQPSPGYQQAPPNYPQPRPQ